MKVIVDVEGSVFSSVVMETTEENLSDSLAAFFTYIGIHLAEELAPSRASRLLETGNLHMFDHGKLVDYKFRLAE